MAPKRDAEPLRESPSPVSFPLFSRVGDGRLPLSCQKGVPDTQDTPEENTSRRAECRQWPKCRDLCHNRLVQMAIALIVGVVLGGIFSRVIVACPPGSPSCPNKWIRSDGQCYFISRETNNWKSSLEFCQSEGGTLLTMDDETQKDIKTLYDLTGDYWVGLRKEKGEWKQMNGSVWTGPIE